jgi:hypothetical protein
MKSLKERFEANYLPEPTSGCWIWVGSIMACGYGQIGFNYRNNYAHRVSYELHRGPIAFGLQVCHSCDNKWCVNPDHLFLGTPQDNSSDMVRKSRQTAGEKNPMSRLTPELIQSILQAPGTQREVAAKFGITQPHVSAIRSKKRWAHVA